MGMKKQLMIFVLYWIEKGFIMKTSLLKFLVIALLIPAFLTFQVFAKEPDKQTIVTLGKTEVVNKDYFAVGDTVIVSGTVNGDAFVAGRTIIVDGTVNGDLLAAGGTIQVLGTVKNNIRAVAGTITVNSRVGGNVTLGGGNVAIADTAVIAGSVVAGAGNLEVFAPVGKGMTIGGGNILIGNKVGGDVVAGTQQLTLLKGTVIKGSLTYWSNEDARVIDGATASGGLTKHALPKNEWQTKKITAVNQGARAAKFATGFTALWAIATIIFLFILGLILFHLFPNFTTKTVDIMQKNPWQSLGKGLVAAIVLPVVAMVLLFTVIGIPISIFIFFVLGILYVLADLFASLFVGERVLSWLKVKPHRAWQLITGLVLLAIILFVPIIGWIVKAGLVLAAIGAILTEKYSVYREMRTKNIV